MWPRLVSSLFMVCLGCGARFDFWIGEWTVKDPKGVVVGQNRIENSHRGCALIENWTSARGGTGLSTKQLFEQSKDGGQKWIAWFDGYYSKRG